MCVFLFFTFILRLVLDPVNESTLTLTLWPLLTTSATLATRPSLRSSEMWTRPSHRFLEIEKMIMDNFNNEIRDRTKEEISLNGMH